MAEFLWMKVLTFNRLDAPVIQVVGIAKEKMAALQDPVTLKRSKFISRVSEQLEVANLLVKGEPIPFTSFHDPVSLKRLRKVSPWWWTDKDGKYLMAIQYGTQVIELAKGKPAVQAENLDQIIEVLKSLKLATSNGELDLHLTQAGELIRRRFKPSE